jgi:hypothetical protein
VLTSSVGIKLQLPRAFAGAPELALHQRAPEDGCPAAGHLRQIDFHISVATVAAGGLSAYYLNP